MSFVNMNTKKTKNSKVNQLDSIHYTYSFTLPRRKLKSNFINKKGWRNLVLEAL